MIPKFCDESNTRICTCFFPYYHVELQSLNVIFESREDPYSCITPSDTWGEDDGDKGLEV
jgi:hypothetical protein